ncbi:hypothetical protein [Vreelandella titanicae]|uniref:hypothetical protein n=1 Tax=Vreelandella titanicae TaxID=664683 RepID=UPI003FD77C31
MLDITLFISLAFHVRAIANVSKPLPRVNKTAKPSAEATHQRVGSDKGARAEGKEDSAGISGNTGAGIKG